MERVTEPELMDDVEQARAYSEADFADPHQAVVTNFLARFPEFGAEERARGQLGHNAEGPCRDDGARDRVIRVIDLACGPADVTTRLARALPHATFVGVDGAAAMIALGRDRVARAGLADRVAFECRLLPDPTLRDLGPFDAAVCSGALHHFHDPLVVWHTLRDVGGRGTCILVQDLTRPDSTDAAHALVDRYAGDEPEILRRDYFHSLCAAFTLAEIRAQLCAVGFEHFDVDAVSDRHVVVSGRVR
jgi:SAM-dependent methyltransferase